MQQLGADVRLGGAFSSRCEQNRAAKERPGPGPVSIKVEALTSLGQLREIQYSTRTGKSKCCTSTNTWIFWETWKESAADKPLASCEHSIAEKRGKYLCLAMRRYNINIVIPEVGRREVCIEPSGVGLLHGTSTVVLGRMWN